ADAQAEVDSSFIRRHQVVSVVGLPLLAGKALLGLLYLDFQEPSRAPDAVQLAELERLAGEAAETIRAALADAEREALAALGRLAGAGPGRGRAAAGGILRSRQRRPGPRLPRAVEPGPAGEVSVAAPDGPLPEDGRRPARRRTGQPAAARGPGRRQPRARGAEPDDVRHAPS